MGVMREINQAEFEEVCRGDALVVFGGAGCLNCRMQYAILDQLEAGMVEKGVEFCKIDTAGAMDLAAKFGVVTMPTLLLVKEGAIVETLGGLKPKPVIAKKLEEVFG